MLLYLTQHINKSCVVLVLIDSERHCDHKRRSSTSVMVIIGCMSYIITLPHWAKFRRGSLLPFHMWPIWFMLHSCIQYACPSSSKVLLIQLNEMGIFIYLLRLGYFYTLISVNIYVNLYNKYIITFSAWFHMEPYRSSLNHNYFM